jgi:hypothetical protein
MPKPIFLDSEGDPLPTRVENYLDHVTAPLVGRVPCARRHELREELANHLRSLLEEKDAAVEESIALTEVFRQLGSPSRLAKTYLEEFFGKPSDPKWTIFPLVCPESLKIAFRWFGGAAIVTILLYPFLVIDLQVAPEGIIFFAVLPLAAGVLTGIQAPQRQGGSAYVAIMSLFLFYHLLSQLLIYLLHFIPWLHPYHQFYEFLSTYRWVLAGDLFIIWYFCGYIPALLIEWIRLSDRRGIRRNNAT